MSDEEEGAPGESNDEESAHDDDEEYSESEESEEEPEKEEETEKEEPGPYCEEAVKVLEGHYSFVRAVCAHPTRNLCVSASADCCLRVWDAQSLMPKPDDGKYDVEYEDGTVQKKVPREKIKFRRAARQALKARGEEEPEKLEIGTEVQINYGDDENIEWHNGVVVEPEGDSVNGMEIEGHKKAVWACAFHPKGKLLLSASEDATLCWWSVPVASTGNWDCVTTLTGHSRPVLGIAMHPRGIHAVSCSADWSMR